MLDIKDFHVLFHILPQIILLSFYGKLNYKIVRAVIDVQLQWNLSYSNIYLD